MSFTIARKGVLLIALPVIAQVSFGIALIAIGRRAVDAHGWELHSQQVLRRAYNVRFALIAAQSSLRGFVLTGNPKFRETCEAAAREVPRDVTALSSFVADNVGQTARVKLMSGAANAFIGFQEMNAALVDRRQREEAAANITRRTGDQLMARFQAVMGQFLDEEVRLANERHAQASSANHVASIVVVSGMVLNVAIAVLLAVVFSASINRRLNVLTENALRLTDDRPLLAPLDPGDEIAAVDRIFHQMAAKLAQAIEDLRQANREIEAFSYSVSHDLRAPLRAIDGFSRILEEDHTEHLDAEAKRLLGVVRRNTVMMAQLIDDLLSFSRLARQPIEKADVNMRKLAESTWADVSRDSGVGRNIEFILGDLPRASGDTAMLRQVMTNLLSNAVKFTAPRDPARVEFGGESRNGESVYYVRDNGVGFDMRYVDKLFGVFQRLHAATEFEGTGVGLAIVQRVVQRHGGRVWAESTLHQGSNFYFTLKPAEGGTNV
jgi:signal transduction histidine kinase